MERHDDQDAGKSDLRRKAEALVHENPTYAMRHGKDDLERLLQELQIYQAELEAQNIELRDAQLELRTTRDRYSDLFNAAPIIYITLDEAGIITQINATGRKILGVNRRQTEGRAFYRAIADKDRERFLEFLAKVQTSDEEQSCEVELARLPDEPRCVLRLEAIRSFDENALSTEVRIAAADITDLCTAREGMSRLNGELERRVKDRTREVEQKTVQLRALAEALARAEVDERRAIGIKLHDSLAQTLVACRMKLTAMRGKFKKAGVEDELHDLDALLAEATQYTRGLISDLNPLPIEGGGLEPALKHLFNEMKKYGLSTDYQFTCEFDLSNHAAVILYQCIRELLFNVVKHAGVDAAWVYVQRNGDQVQIAVVDKGVGIINPDNSVLPIEGRRFGLFSVQERIQRLGGTLVVESRPREGTTCTLIVPNSNHPRNEIPSSPVLLRRNKRRSHASVLIVDDHPAVRQGLKQRLDLHPALSVLDEARDGIEAIEKARALHPDVIIMDINMPSMDGIEATRRIMAEMPDTCVVGLSIRDDERAQREMMSAGAVGLVNKGQPLDLLFELLESTCVQSGIAPAT
ncbi:MAG: response regulator [Candidatus Hydrogenedentes bacterium]|nr:response regulator [Candidatus Hydrogenedentota bacterium]